jgi:hypothetical protein
MNRLVHSFIWTVFAAATLALGGCSATRSGSRGLGHCECPDQLPDPRGSHVQAINELQAGKAEADDFVIYQHEWKHGGVELGPAGRRHLETIAQRLPQETFNVVVETSDDANLDERRREAVLSRLAALGLIGVEARVLVGRSAAEGLSPADADRVASGMNNTQGRTGVLSGISGSGGLLGGFRGSFARGFTAF